MLINTMKRPLHIRRYSRQMFDTLESRQHLSVNVKVNFQPASSGAPGGFLADTGAVYASRGNGQTYGWNSDNAAGLRDRGVMLDQAFDTGAHMTWEGVTRTWEMAVPNGSYDLRLVGGDAGFLDSINRFDVEGVPIKFLTPTDLNRFGDGRATIRVTDGRLTIAAANDASNAKLAFVEIRSRTDNAPAINRTPIRINFQPAGAAPVAGYLIDSGQGFAARDAGLSYGWTADNTSGAIERAESVDQRYDTHVVFRTDTPRTWSLSVPNGSYTVRLVMGDTRLSGDDYRIDVEGQPLVRAKPTTPRFFENTRTVTVSDGSITLSRAAGSRNNKLAFIEVVPQAQPMNVVSVARVDATATTGNSNDFATVRFTRTGPITQPLEINYRLSGAAAWQMRGLLFGTITIPANKTSRTMSIVVPATPIIEASRALSVALDPTPVFSTGLSSSTRVTINDTRTFDENQSVNWANSSRSPGGIYTESMVAAATGRTFLIGGFTSSFEPVDDVWMLDHTTGDWTARADSPDRITHAGVAVDGNNVWMIGGYTGNEGGGQTFGTNAVRVYNITTNTWSNGPSLPATRSAGNAVVVNRTLYFFGGHDITRSNETPDMWALNLDNPTGGWVTRAQMTLSRNHASAVDVNGRIFLMGGQTGFDEGLTPKNEVQIYDPIGNQWAVQSWTLPQPRSHTTQSTFISGNRIYMIGGEEQHNQFRNTTWRINPIAGVVSELSNLPQSRLSPAAFAFNGGFLVIGGYNGDVVSQTVAGSVLS